MKKTSLWRAGALVSACALACTVIAPGMANAAGNGGHERGWRAGGVYTADGVLLGASFPIPNDGAPFPTVQPGNTAVYLDWPDRSAATQYRVDAYNAATGVLAKSVTTALANTAPSPSNAAVTGLVNGTPYNFFVTSIEPGADYVFGAVSGTPVAVAPRPTKAPTLSGATTYTTITVAVTALSATGINPITGYQVRFTPADGGPVKYATADTATLKATAVDLTPNVNYAIDYAGVNTVGGNPAIGPYGALALTAKPTGAPAPGSVRVTREANRTVSLDWSDVAGATSYQIYYRTVGATAWTAYATKPTVSNGNVVGLSNTQGYEFQVAANVTVNGATKVGDRSISVFGQPAGAPIPTEVRLVAPAATAMYLDWAPVAGAEAYYIKTELIDAQGVAAPKVPAAVKIATTASATAKAVTGLSTGVLYRFSVATLLDGQIGDYSSETVTAATVAVPGIINPVKGTITSTSINVTWSAPAAISGVDPANRYEVTYTPSNGAPAKVQTLGNVTSTTVTGLVPGVTYTVSIRAGNAAGWGMTSSTPLKIVTANKPGAVGEPLVERSQDRTVAIVTFDAPYYKGDAAINSYTVTPKKARPAGAAPAAQTGTGLVYTFTGLDPNADYTFGIYATTDSGNGPTVTVGNLYNAPESVGKPTYDLNSATATFKWFMVDDESLGYQAQAYQRGFGTKTSETIVKPADVTCAAGVCTAVFDDFSDNISGDGWVFRVRTTDYVVSTSNWVNDTAVPVDPNAGFEVRTARVGGSCPNGYDQISDTLCRTTMGYTYHTESYTYTTREEVGQYGRPSQDSPCAPGEGASWAQWPNGGTGGWVCVMYADVQHTGYTTVRDATPAGWSDSGSYWYKDVALDPTVTYMLKSDFPWTIAERAQRGIAYMVVDGAMVDGATEDLGRCPGTVVAQYLGLSGSGKPATFNLCN